MTSKQLTTDQAMVLQQVYEDGEDDIRSLSYELGMSRRRTIAEVLRLEQKGLIDFHHSFDGLVLVVSKAGKQLVRQHWPEAWVMFA